MPVRRPVRSLLISSHFPPQRGGAGVVYDQLCRHLGGRITALGARRDYATNLPIAAAGAFDAGAPYPIVRLPLLRPPDRPRQSRLVSRLVFPVADLPILMRALFVAAWLGIRRRARVVCIGDLISLGWMVWPLRYLLRFRVIFYVHGEELTVASTGLFFRLRGSSLRRANAIVAVSGFTRNRLVADFGIEEARIRVISNGVDLDHFTPGQADEAVIRRFGAADGRIILGVGRLIERKGFDTLVEAMPAVLARVPEARCWIAGEGPLRDALAARISRLGLAGRTELLGPVSDEALLALYRRAEIFAMPNRQTAGGDTEGFGLVFLEANACGRPVVAGRAGGAVEAVTDGCNGLLVDGESADRVAAALLRLLTDRALYARLSAGARARAVASGWAERAAAYQGLCEAVAKT
ncbi:MAG: glycosyltransferase family 4 protein [Stellaceae bacterium]